MSLVRVVLVRSWRRLAIAIGAGVVSGLAAAAVLACLPAALDGDTTAREIATFVALAITGVASRALSQILLVRLGQATIVEVRLLLARRIVDAPLRRIEELGGHRLLATMTDDVAAITQACVHLPLVCVDGATVVGCLIYLGWVAPSALGFALAAMALGTAAFQLHQRGALHSFMRAREASDAVFRHLRSLTAGIKELKLHRRRADAFLGDALGTSLAAHRRHHVEGMSAYAIAMGWGTLFFYAALGVSAFALSGATAAAATIALVYLIGPFASLIELVPSLARAAVAIRTIDGLGLALPPEHPRTAMHALAAWKRIELVGVTHRYYREQEDASFQLGPIDLAFGPGEVVYVVGGNGSGKTTLAKLLLGLYTPESGDIRVDGVVIDDASRDRYRELFSVVFADYHLFDSLLGVGGPGPEMEGGRFTRPPGIDERARAHLERFGLAHRVRVAGGELHVDGLSQGQRRRLALVAACLDDRPFYVFDEWAADQDPEFRRIFYTELVPELRARGKTVLVITHDDAYFAMADRCLRMDFGRLVDPGLPASAGFASSGPARAQRSMS